MDAVYARKYVRLEPSKEAEKMKDKINCLLCGVGGQGTVLASRMIAAAAMKRGLFAETAETIGMAQRGGADTIWKSGYYNWI